MADWLMVIITAIYVIATIVICIFNGKSAKASREQAEMAKKQTKEMIRQYNQLNRPIIAIRFDIIRSGLLCFVVENEGPLPAHNVIININDSFINNLSNEETRNQLRRLRNSELFLASRQKITILLDSKTQFSKVATEIAMIEITYDSFIEKTEINLKHYGMLLNYNSSLEDISQNIKRAVEQNKKLQDAILKHMSSQNHGIHVISLPASEEDAIKYRLYKEICMNPGCTIQWLSDHCDLENTKVCDLINELQEVDRWIVCVPGNDTENVIKYECYKQ